MKRRVMVFAAPREIRIVEEPLPELSPGEVTVETIFSAVSPGTERLVYRGEIPRDLPLDSTIPALAGARAAYPLRYGYAAVGRVVARGAGVPAGVEGRCVFCFHPHASHMNVPLAAAVPVPEGIDPRDAVFLATLETALTLVWDGRPLAGETAVLFGQGIVGLMTAALLARHPLGRLVTVDPRPARRRFSREVGAHASLAPGEVAARLADETGGRLADLVYELSGDPAVLGEAIAACGFGGRVVIGSWYGTRRAALDLGGRFHRSRIRLIASQVSTLPAHAALRWDRERLREACWEFIRVLRPSRFIGCETPLEAAAEAYAMLDREEGGPLQILLTYRRPS
ncbi:MAG: zinc-binding alcohol dehydrogenase [Desulfobacterales bacterium]